MREQRNACPGCGTYREDWYDDRGRLCDPPPFEPVALRCPGCADRDRLRDSIDEEGKGDMRGVYIALRPFDPDHDIDSLDAVPRASTDDS